MEKPTILFMGTPRFAVFSLALLVEAGYPLVGVVTQPDRPSGRGRVMTGGPVKEFASKHELPLFQVARVSEKPFLSLLKELSPQMIVLAAFGQLLPRSLLEFPPWGCLNVHPSLLPKHRGAAPINWTLIKGEHKTGVTIMLMDEGLDSGDILLQEETLIHPDETYDELHDRLAVLGAQLLLKAIGLRLQRLDSPRPQNHLLATYAPKITKEDSLIDWNQDTTSIVNLIRGLSSSPGAHTYVQGKLLKIFRAEGRLSPPEEPPGSIIINKSGLSVAARNGYVSLKILQWENKSILPVHEFKKGLRISPGAVLGRLP